MPSAFPSSTSNWCIALVQAMALLTPSLVCTVPREGSAPCHLHCFLNSKHSNPVVINAIEVVPQDSLTERIKRAYQCDDVLRMMINEKIEDPSTHPNFALEDGLLFYKGLILVPPDDDIRREILVLCHDDPRAGH